MKTILIILMCIAFTAFTACQSPTPTREPAAETAQTQGVPAIPPPQAKTKDCDLNVYVPKGFEKWTNAKKLNEIVTNKKIRSAKFVEKSNYRGHNDATTDEPGTIFLRVDLMCRTKGSKDKDYTQVLSMADLDKTEMPCSVRADSYHAQPSSKGLKYSMIDEGLPTTDFSKPAPPQKGSTAREVFTNGFEAILKNMAVCGFEWPKS